MNEHLIPEKFVRIYVKNNGGSYNVDIAHWNEVKDALKNYYASNKMHFTTIELVDDDVTHFLVTESIECVVLVTREKLEHDILAEEAVKQWKKSLVPFPIEDEE